MGGWEPVPSCATVTGVEDLIHGKTFGLGLGICGSVAFAHSRCSWMISGTHSPLSSLSRGYLVSNWKGDRGRSSSSLIFC